MKEFPEQLRVKNKSTFHNFHIERTKCYLRKTLYEHIISKDESDYFVIGEFFKDRSIKPVDQDKIIDDVIRELEQLGWTCKRCYGGSGLFIYSDKPPANCYEL